MKNCKGIFGKIFGHSFESMLIEYTPLNIPGDMSGNVIGIIESMAHKKYKIICKRCGVEK